MQALIIPQLIARWFTNILFSIWLAGSMLVKKKYLLKKSGTNWIPHSNLITKRFDARKVLFFFLFLQWMSMKCLFFAVAGIWNFNENTNGLKPYDVTNSSTFSSFIAAISWTQNNQALICGSFAPLFSSHARNNNTFFSLSTNHEWLFQFMNFSFSYSIALSCFDGRWTSV